MIKIRIKRKNDLSDWYSQEMVKCLQDRKIRYESENLTSVQEEFLQNSNISAFLDYIETLSEDSLKQLLTIPVYEMKENAPDLYLKIQPYWEFCSWYCRLQNQVDKETENDAFQKPLSVLKSTASNGSLPDWTIIFDKIMQKTGKNRQISVIHSVKRTNKRSGKNFEKINRRKVTQYVEQLKKTVKALNDALSGKIQYSYMPAEVRRELVSRMDVKVCPYCNQGYVYSLSYTDDEYRDHIETYLGDIDHLLPKNIFGLFSLSLWNLVPCCKTCNQLFKRTDTKGLLNPLQEGFEEDCHLTVKWDENLNVDMITGMSDRDHKIKVAWEIDPCLSILEEGRRKRIQNSIDTFQLDLLYNVHQDIIKDTLRRKMLWNSAYRETVEELANQIGMQELSHEELYRLWYGVSMNPDKDQYEIHGKMIRDLVQER